MNFCSKVDNQGYLITLADTRGVVRLGFQVSFKQNMASLLHISSHGFSNLNLLSFPIRLYCYKNIVFLKKQVGYEPFLEYNDMSGQPGRRLSPSFDVDISDGNWHQIALSVQAQSVTLYVDCMAEMMEPLARNSSSNLPLNTVLSLGKPYISDSNYPTFEVTMGTKLL